MNNTSSSTGGFPVARLRSTITWTVFGVGGTMNLMLLHLILNHTPMLLKQYSKILLQTCFTDLALLLVTALTDVVNIDDSDGGNETWMLGPLRLLADHDPDRWLWLGWFAFLAWMYLVYASICGSVTQFIYRFLMINRGYTLSTRQYFALFGAITLVPLVYCGVFCIPNYPPVEHRFLVSPEAQAMMGVVAAGGASSGSGNDTNTNNSSQPQQQRITLIGYGKGNALVTAGFYYFVVVTTIGYALIVVLGWLTHVHIRRHLHGGSNNQQMTMEAHRQVTKTLIIMVAI